MLDHSTFLERARKHQHRFLLERFETTSVCPPRVHLPRKPAEQGANFVPVPAVKEALQKRYPKGWRNDLMPYKLLFYDMLRSQHVPFNLFGPLVQMRETALGAAFFGRLLGMPVSTLEAIEIEHAPSAAKKLLNDNTSFDAFVIVSLTNGRRIALGFEVKYTEGAYSWGEAERHRMHDGDSSYARLTRVSNLYRDGALQLLCTRRQKQMWRNHLLGAAVLQTQPDITHFCYIVLHPGLSGYCHEVVRQYRELLQRSASDDAYRAVTYEEFLHTADAVIPEIDGVNWASYARSRYIFAS